MGQKIIVTGAGGLIGQAVCTELSLQGLGVLEVVRQTSGNEIKNRVQIDLSEKKDITKYFKESIAGVVHLAAAVPHSYLDSEESANYTRTMDENVLSAVRKWGCPVIYMSSCGLYDRLLPEVKYEKNLSQIKIISPYFSAKYDGEKEFSNVNDSVILRLSAPIGNGLRRRLVVARFIDQARENKALQIWGAGMREQNFVDARDVARIVVMALRNSYEGVVNVAAKEPVTMLTLAQKVVGIINSGWVEFSGGLDPAEGETARYSIELAKEIYGWYPEFSLEDSILSLSKIAFGK